jgi:hypothetical protein
MFMSSSDEKPADQGAESGQHYPPTNVKRSSWKSVRHAAMWPSLGFIAMVLFVYLSAHTKRVPRHTLSMNNIEEIAEAMVGYSNEHGHLPVRASVDKSGKALLSWRVHLLPALGYKSLYKKFHLDEPWDSPHNQTLIAEMPEIYNSPGSPELARQGRTAYQVPVGTDTIYSGAAEVSPGRLTKLVRENVMLVEVDPDRAVVWTKPEDHAYNTADPFAGLGENGYPGGFIYAMGSGEASFCTIHAEPHRLRMLFELSVLYTAPGP